MLEEQQAERAREAKEAEERRIRELERQIEEMKKREDLFLAKLNERSSGKEKRGRQGRPPYVNSRRIKRSKRYG